MRYCISDVHGEYELFMKLLEKIKFSDEDELYISGDIIDKGKDSVRLARYIMGKPNIHTIIGNHEYDFLKLYHSLTEADNVDFNAVLERLRAYFPDGVLLDYDIIDWLDSLPFYIEGEDFICVHAGLPIDPLGNVVHPSEADERDLVYDRRFKEPKVLPVTDKCILFGHTTTSNISGENKLLAYRRRGVERATKLSDYCKIHLDTGAWSHGILGCLCMDTCKVYYVRRT